MRKINFLILILLVISSNLIQAQKAGVVVYQINSIDFIPKEKNFEIESVIEYAKKQKFILNFNNNINSSFKVNEVALTNDENATESFYKKIASLRFTCNYNYFFDKINNNEFYEMNDGILVKKKYQIKNWEITKETKNIDKYLCYKAMYRFDYLARDNKIKTRVITAWFAPSLPFAFGPKNYNGLPGLILELQDWNTTFLATKIDLTEEVIKIEFPKGKTLTEEEYEKKTTFRNFRN